MMLNQLTFCKMVLQRFGMHENHSNHLELIFSTFTEIYRTRPGNSLRHFPACHWPWLLLWLWCVFRGMRECLSVEEYVSVLSLCPSLTPHRQNRDGGQFFLIDETKHSVKTTQEIWVYLDPSGRVQSRPAGRNSCSHCICGQQVERWTRVLSSLSSFYSVQDPNSWRETAYI